MPIVKPVGRDAPPELRAFDLGPVAPALRVHGGGHAQRRRRVPRQTDPHRSGQSPAEAPGAPQIPVGPHSDYHRHCRQIHHFRSGPATTLSLS